MYFFRYQFNSNININIASGIDLDIASSIDLDITSSIDLDITSIAWTWTVLQLSMSADLFFAAII